MMEIFGNLIICLVFLMSVSALVVISTFFDGGGNLLSWGYRKIKYVFGLILRTKKNYTKHRGENIIVPSHDEPQNPVIPKAAGGDEAKTGVYEPVERKKEDISDSADNENGVSEDDENAVPDIIEPLTMAMDGRWRICVVEISGNSDYENPPTIIQELDEAFFEYNERYKIGSSDDSNLKYDAVDVAGFHGYLAFSDGKLCYVDLNQKGDEFKTGFNSPINEKGIEEMNFRAVEGPVEIVDGLELYLGCNRFTFTKIR